jgi:hypothetical protein
MNSYPNRERQTQASLLESIEQAIHEKAQTGRANEARHGFAARVANATPPVNEAFRRSLRARILAPGAEKRTWGRTGQDRTRPVHRWRLVLATLAVVLVLVVWFWSPRTVVVELNDVPVGRPGSRGRLTSEDFDALAEALNRLPAPRTVLVYPDRASPIAERVRHETVPLVLGKGTKLAAIDHELSTILSPGEYVDLVMAGAEDDDTTRQVRAAIEQTLYRLYRPSGQADIETFGALERSTFLAGPADVALEPIGALFEGGIELVAGGVLDEPQPGGSLRMAFDWRIQEPVSDSLVMYVHLIREDVELVAQRDAVPGNGLFPVQDWQPGELVRDQFALLLPPSLPAGEYEVRVGIYDATTGMRRSLAEAEGESYVVVRQLIVRQSPEGTSA